MSIVKYLNFKILIQVYGKKKNKKKEAAIIALSLNSAQGLNGLLSMK